MTDPIRRAFRGLVQGGIAETMVQFIEAFLAELNEAQHIALLGVLTVVVTFAQNYLEDTTAIPALLKAPASEGVNPMPDPEAGRLSTAAVTAVASAGMFLILVAWALGWVPR